MKILDVFSPIFRSTIKFLAALFCLSKDAASPLEKFINKKMPSELTKFGILYKDGISKVRPDSPLHDFYLMQRMPDNYITTMPERRAFYRELFDEHAQVAEPWYDPVRIVQFMNLVDIANKLPSGDYLELGTLMGHSARLIWRLMLPDFRLYCFDTFEGFVEKDVQEENKLFNKDILVSMLPAVDMDEVKNYIDGGSGAGNITLAQGWFPESFQEYESLKLRFIHIDLDLYRPTKEALETLWPRLAPGGVMILHDYGCTLFPGIKKAVDEFFTPLGITPIPMGDMQESAVIIKSTSPL